MDENNEIKGMFDLLTLEEDWRPVEIPCIPKGHYSVSSFGRVRNNKTNHVLKGTLRHDGYLTVFIKWIDNKFHCMVVHRIVALTFVSGRTDDKNFVNHKNGIKTFNYSYNLEWVTNLENIQHAMKYGLVPVVLGEKRPTSKLSDSDVEKICEYILEFHGRTSDIRSKCIDNGINVTPDQINAIKCKKAWDWISDKYFIKHDTRIMYILTYEQVETICVLLIAYNGDCKSVLRDMSEDIPYLTYNRIFRIKTKEKWKSISDRFFSFDGKSIKEVKI